MDGYLGTIMMCGFSFAPKNWAYCQGAAVPISQNEALFSLLGQTFGGDGRTNFGLPNLAGGVVPGGFGNSTRYYRCEMGQTIGARDYPLSIDQMPAHTHNMKERSPGQTLNVQSTATLGANKTAANASTPENNYCAPYQAGRSAADLYATTQDTTMSSSAINIQTTGTLNFNNLEIENTGNNQNIIPLQPTLGLNFVICMQGLYPSRS